MHRNGSIICLVITLLFSCSTLINAQDVQRKVETLSSHIQRSVQSKELGWRLVTNTMVGNTTSKNHLMQGWKSDKDHVRLSLLYLESQAEAEKAFQMAVHAISVGSTGKIEGLGDEASIWENHNEKGGTTIIFRKGNTLINVNGTTSEAARRFAQHVADSL